MYEEPDFDMTPELPDIPPRYIDATDFPNTPINPLDLFNKVKTQLESYKLVVPDKSKEMVEDLCKGFNECIRLNSNNKDKKQPQTLVFSPKTGSAKSVTAKMYISMLTNEDSLVVVPTVEDANTFCEDINNWSGDSNYARCTYSVNNDNPKKKYHVEKQDTINYRCIVITHNMYIEINKYPSRKLFKALENKDTKLVIIDERISLYNRYTITSAQVLDLIDIFTKIDNKTDYDLKVDIYILNVVSDLFKELKEQTTNDKKRELILPLKKQPEMNIKAFQFSNIGEVLNYDSIIDLTKYITKINGISSKQTNEDLKSSISELIEIIKKIGNEDFSFHTTGEYETILFTNNIKPLFGSSVVLDATASINEIYKNTTYYKSSNIKHIMTTDPRIYNNFTIKIAKGYPQGRSSIYKGQTATEAKKILNNYTRLALSLLDSDDNLLIVTFKDIVEPLQKLLKNDDRICITNWGNHVGKNNWSHCNKVMIIGWYRMPDTEYYGNYINSMNSIKEAEYNLREHTIKRFKNTQLVDDLVQATMRCSARKIVSTDGDCTKSEAYIFYADNAEGEMVINQYIKEFAGTKVKDWDPKQLLTNKKVSKSTSNIDRILAYLEQELKDKDSTIMNKDIIANTGLSRAIVSRTVGDKKFLEELDKHGFTTKQINKQSKAFVLK